MIEVRPLGLDGVVEITPKRIRDDRGCFSETWNQKALLDAGIELTFVQDNYSLSRSAGTLRGLHFQSPPSAQDKLIRVIRGAIFDVIVDIRKGSSDFGKWVAVELSSENWKQVLAPKGFAHGFVTLVPNTEVIYKVTDYYSRDCDAGIRFDDPDIAVQWPSHLGTFELSDKDRKAPFLRDLSLEFPYP